MYKYAYFGKSFLRKWARNRLISRGVDIPLDVSFGRNLGLPHPYGIVVHPYTIIGDNVRIYQNVTIGRGDIYNDRPAEDFEGFSIGDGAVLCSGAKIICSHGMRTIGKNSVVAANSVVLEDVEDNVIVAGIPARVVKKRDEKK